MPFALLSDANLALFRSAFRGLSGVTLLLDFGIHAVVKDGDSPKRAQ
jgi:hypothetical protein